MGQSDVVVQPVIFHRVMDTVPVSAWQIIQRHGGLSVLTVGLGEGVTPEDVAAGLHRELHALGVSRQRIIVREVDSIPRTPIGKAPLIRGLQPGQT